MGLFSVQQKLLAVFTAIFLFYFSANAQTTIVFGKVTTVDKEPVDGAAIYLINTSLGASSDTEGKFQIDNIPIGRNQLVFSYLSFQSDTISIFLNPNQVLDLGTIVLSESINRLSEIEVSAQLQKGSENKAINLT